MPEMVNAYLQWDAGLGDGDLGGAYPGQGRSGLRLHVMDIFSECSLFCYLNSVLFSSLLKVPACYRLMLSMVQMESRPH